MEFKAMLLSAYEIRSLKDLNWFLGIQIIKSDDKLYLCQDSYIKKLVEKYQLINIIHQLRTPLQIN